MTKEQDNLRLLIGSNSQSVLDWNISEIRIWLKNLNLDQFESNFMGKWQCYFRS